MTTATPASRARPRLTGQLHDWLIERLIFAKPGGYAAAEAAAEQFALSLDGCTESHVSAPSSGPCALCVGWKLQRAFLHSDAPWRGKPTSSGRLAPFLWLALMQNVADHVVLTLELKGLGPDA